MKSIIIEGRYLVAYWTFEEDEEGHVILCDTLDEAKHIGEKWADRDSDPGIVIYEIADGVLFPVFHGNVPEPRFVWEEVK